MTAYYNEFDPNAAAWLRELIKMKLIADGDVDERSILDIQPDDLKRYRQCHFFAGIGGWSYALRLAGIPDDYPIWTASLPCQPFSIAGKQLGKKMMNDTYCRTSSNLSNSADLSLSLGNRCLELLSTAGSTIYKITWKEKVTPRGRRYLQQQASVPRTSDKDCTGWLSPRARGDAGGSRWTNGIVKNLEDQAQLVGWQTPKASDGVFATPMTSGRPMEKSTHLQTQVVALMSNHERCTLPMLPTRSDKALARAKQKAGCSNPKAQVPLVGWPTPQTVDVNHSRTSDPQGYSIRQMDRPNRSQSLVSGTTQSTSDVEITNTGRLNPAFSRWLMGYPEEWCIAAIQASRSMPTQRKKRVICD